MDRGKSITDQTMSNMTGEALSIELLRHRPDIPILICTGHSESISPESTRKIGIKGFLQKPVELEFLLQSVRETLDRID